MGVPTSEVGYTAAMPRREDHEVHKDTWWHWTKKKIDNFNFNSKTPIDTELIRAISQLLTNTKECV